MRRNGHSLIVVLVLLVGFVTEGSHRLVRAQSSKVSAINISDFVPLENGRTWTYQWVVSFAGGRKRTMSRTKSFAGPEFLPTGYAHRFVSDSGDYTLLSVEKNRLLMHGTVDPQRSIRFIFDPPVVLYSPDMELGRRYRVTQEDGGEEGTRQWTTVVDGFEDIETPMGKFNQCLKMRLEMEGSGVRTKAVYYYVRQLGLVVYEYESWVEGQDRPEVTVDARLKLAQVGSHTLTSASQLETLREKIAAGMPRFDDPEARKVFQHAYEHLYFWPAKFPGFKADFTLVRGNDPSAAGDPVRGQITVTPDLKIKAKSESNEAKVQVETELSQFITHLKTKPFETEFAEAIITFAGDGSAEGTKVNVSAENTMGTSYRIKERKILQIAHSYGRVRFEVDNRDFVTTDDGRLIGGQFSITYYSNETNQVVGRMEFTDEYTKVGNFWLPKKRVKTEAAKGRSTTLVLEFLNHHLLK